MKFADSFIADLIINKKLRKILRTHTRFSMVTNSKSLLDIFTEATCKTGKRLVIDLQTVRNVYMFFEVSDVVPIKSKQIIFNA